MTDPGNPFTRAQRAFYDREAARWTPADRDPVVGSFDAHNAWGDYEFLFDGLETAGKVALDFGCGPGRCLVRYADRFLRVDGADVAAPNLANAKVWAILNAVKVEPALFLVDGVSLSGVPDGRYDVVFSTICLQHIPVHSIRLNLFREFYRVLAPGGWVTAQMGYGETDDPRGVAYHEDRLDAVAMNGGCDVNVTDGGQLRADLVATGFDGNTFRAVVRPPGPSDWHPNWVFFRARRLFT